MREECARRSTRGGGPWRNGAARGTGLRHLVAAIAWLCLPATVQAQGTVQVLVRGGGAVLADAAVRLRSLPDSSLTFAATTNDAGIALFATVADGRYELTVQRLGYGTERRELTVADTGSVRVSVVLRETAVGLPGILVESERRRARYEESAGATVIELTQGDLKLLPAFGEPDVLRAVEVLPGVVSTSDFSSSFNVRGGSADQNLILLDGIPVYNPFHLGGLFSVFNADMVERSELLAGGFPAQYGGRVSSVLSVESQAAGTGTDVQSGVSVLAARAAVGVDVPDDVLRLAGLQSGRVRMSARRSYFDQLLRPFFDFPYHLTDVQLFGEAWSEGGTRLTLTGYTGRDVLDLAGSESFPLKVRWGWGNDLLGAGLSLPLGYGRVLDLRAGHTRFETDIVFPEFGDTEFSSRIDQSLLRAELGGRRGGMQWRVGGAADRIDYHNLARSGGTVFGEASDQGWMTGVFAQQSVRLGAWLVETGLRADTWLPASTGSRTVLQPRVGVKRFLGAAGDVAVKAAAGRYAQFVHSLRDEELPLGIDVWVLSGLRAPVTVSEQAQLGIEAFLGSGWFVGVESYYRRFDGVVATNTAENPDVPEDDLLRGTGTSWGADLQLRRDAGMIRPALAVSLLKATREYADIGVDPEDPPTLAYPPVYDRRLDVDLVVQAMLPRNWQLGVRWNLGTGLPYTRPVGAYLSYDYSLRRGRWHSPLDMADTTMAVVLGPRNAERYPVYHRLDAGIRKTFRKEWGSMTPFIDVLNVYNRRNVLFYFYEYDRSPPIRSGVSMFPVLPTVGLEVRF